MSPIDRERMPDTLTDLVRTLNLTFGPSGPEPRWPPPGGIRRLPRAFVMSDRERMPDPVAMLDTLPYDVAMIFRHYKDPYRVARAQEVVSRAHQMGIQVLVAGDPRLARRVGADGVHLPGHLLRRRVLTGLAAIRPDWLITAAVHDQRELIRATGAHVDAVMVSPVFSTTTRVQRQALGVIGLRRMTASARMPVFALGGLNTSILPRLRPCGAVGFAGVGEFLRRH